MILRPVSLRGFFPDESQGPFEYDSKPQAYWQGESEWPYFDERANSGYAAAYSNDMKRFIEGGHYADLELHLEPHLKTKKRRLFSLDETDLIEESQSSEVGFRPFKFHSARPLIVG